MKIGLIGYGKMGKCVEKHALSRGHSIYIGNDPQKADLFIDFSIAEAVLPNLEMLATARKPVVIGTTGWNIAQGEAIVVDNQGTALYAPNFSLGIAYFMQLLEKACGILVDYTNSGVEVHHTEKRDAPSGTAKKITQQFGIPFTSQREGKVAGKHTVVFDSPEDRICLTHEAKSRDGFALGAVKVAEWIVDQTGWLTLDDYLHSSHHTLSQ